MATWPPWPTHLTQNRCYLCDEPVSSLTFTINTSLVASLVAQSVKHLLAMRETWVRSLGREDPLEKDMVTHSSTLAWKIPWTEEPGRLQSMGSQRVGHAWATSFSLFTFHTLYALLNSHNPSKEVLLIQFRDNWSRGRGHIYIPMGDSCWYLAETNKIL